MTELEALLDYRFKDSDLLTQALTHRSYAARHNERLEFLGDGVLNCVVGLMLYLRFPELPEGRLSRLRANLVNQQPLYEIAREIGVGPRLRLGEGELRSGGRERPSILADALESVLGAALLDGGFAAVQDIIERLFATRVAAIDPSAQGKDAKTRLQEWLQSRRHALPSYTLQQTTGLAHAQTFTVECLIPALDLVTVGQGASRKAAEQEAAQCALDRLEQREEG
jgi:ribonuclease III